LLFKSNPSEHRCRLAIFHKYPEVSTNDGDTNRTSSTAHTAADASKAVTSENCGVLDRRALGSTVANADGSWISLTYHHVDAFEQLIEIDVVLLVSTLQRGKRPFVSVFPASSLVCLGNSNGKLKERSIPYVIGRQEMHHVFWTLRSTEAGRAWRQCNVWTPSSITQQYVRPPS
jgi:hypothetical protein